MIPWIGPVNNDRPASQGISTGIHARCVGICSERKDTNPINENDVCSNEMVQYALNLLLSSLRFIKYREEKRQLDLL